MYPWEQQIAWHDSTHPLLQIHHGKWKLQKESHQCANSGHWRTDADIYCQVIEEQSGHREHRFNLKRRRKTTNIVFGVIFSWSKTGKCTIQYSPDRSPFTFTIPFSPGHWTPRLSHPIFGETDGWLTHVREQLLPGGHTPLFCSGRSCCFALDWSPSNLCIEKVLRLFGGPKGFCVRDGGYQNLHGLDVCTDLHTNSKQEIIPCVGLE
jgi:hypothetical protein